MPKVICKIKKTKDEKYQSGDLFYCSENNSYYMLIRYADEYNLLNLSTGGCRFIFDKDIDEIVTELRFVKRKYNLTIEESQ